VLNDKLIVERESLGVDSDDAHVSVGKTSGCRFEVRYSCTNLETVLVCGVKVYAAMFARGEVNDGGA
jgi:hypothetical protein